MKPSYSDKSVAKIKSYSSYHHERRTGRQQFREKSSRIEQNKPRLQEKDRFKPQPCDYCGCTGLQTAGKDCPVYGKQCRNCDRWNHLAAVCKSKTRNGSSDMPGTSNKYEKQPEKKFKPKRDLVKKTTEEEVTVHSAPMTSLKIFGNIPKCLNQRDDILIGERNLQEHNRTLEKVLQRVADFVITFNKEKCQFSYKDLRVLRIQIHE